MFNILHRSIIEDNMKWDSLTPEKRLANTIIYGIMLWFLLTSTSLLLYYAGLAVLIYLNLSRGWYYFVLFISKTRTPPDEEEEKKKEK